MRRLETLVGLYLGTALLTMNGCGPAFTSSPGGGGADGGTTSSDATSTSTGTSTCMAGACPDGEYCDPTRGCTPCSDFGVFAPGAPMALGVTLTDSSASALYPRIAQGDGDLLFAQLAVNQGHIKRVTVSGGSWSTPTAIMSLDQTGASDTGPLFTAPGSLAGLDPQELAGATSPVLLFHTTRGTKNVQIFGLPLMPGATPVLLQLPDSEDYVQDIAVASQATPARLFWLHGSDPSQLTLVTMKTGKNNPIDDVSVQLDTCEATVRTPWVTPDGGHLLFSAAGCDKVGSHLYIAELGADGKPTAKARRVFPKDAGIDYSPSLSSKQCSILFSRADKAGKISLYSAKRP